MLLLQIRYCSHEFIYIHLQLPLEGDTFMFLLEDDENEAQKIGTNYKIHKAKRR